MNKLALTNYYNFTKKDKEGHVCPECHRKIKGWALAQCSSCNRFFCRSHMEPSIGHNKKCPHCRERQRTFKINEPIFSAVKSAENKLNEFRLAESEELEDLIFASVFGKNNLIKRAQEETEEQAPEAEQQFEQMPPVAPEPNAPAMPKEPEINIDMAANDLANKVSYALEAVGIDPSSKDVADVINALASDNDKKISLAQKAEKSNSGVNPAAPTQGDLFAAMQDATIRAETPESQKDVIQFTPYEATAANNIWDYYTRTYGAEIFYLVPENNNYDRSVNDYRRGIIATMISQLNSVFKTPDKTINFFRMNGLDPSRVIGLKIR
jgi:hypothetical protein